MAKRVECSDCTNFEWHILAKTCKLGKSVKFQKPKTPLEWGGYYTYCEDFINEK